jgi:hypothetical protein
MQEANLSQLSNLVNKSASNLDGALADFFIDGARGLIDSSISIFAINNFNGFNGYNYWIDNSLIAQLHVGNATNGHFIVYRRIYHDGILTERYDVFAQNGDFLNSDTELRFAMVQYDTIMMDYTSPVINHFYNVLNLEYNQANSGLSKTYLIGTIERLLKFVYKETNAPITIREKQNDYALTSLYQLMLDTELDPVLRWSEKQIVYKNLKNKRNEIIKTKKRAHHLLWNQYNFKITLSDFKSSFKRFLANPFENIKGLTYQYTVGIILWFFSVVRKNLGYSIALAIYSPFTFYFITQPMNPHAMWAVGNVRNAYIAVTNSVEELIGSAPQVTQSEVIKQIQDEVSVKTSSTQRSELRSDWMERMSQFKAMQIAYEGNLVTSERMGRIEFLESQLTFPMLAESTWAELSRYENNIKSIMAFNTNMDQRFKNYLNKELNRVAESKYYVWKKVFMFVLDHPYIIRDLDQEHKYKDYYTEKIFVNISKMTKDINSYLAENKITLPADMQQIEKLALNLEENKIKTDSIQGNLQANSKLFNQSNLFDTDNLRAKIKRHWEILYLQQNKQQESATFSLQTYVWSVRNALWSMQSIYSAKREELPSLAYKFNLDNLNTDVVKADENLNSIYESALHLMTMDFVTVKKEIELTMNGDDEVTLRQDLIQKLNQSMNERDNLFNIKKNMAGNNL